MSNAVAEVATLFAAQSDIGANFGEEVYPGYPGLVVADGQVRTMTWGFPLALTGKQGQKLKPRPVNNAREDKLRSPFWRDSFTRRRCLIPVSQWAEAEGPKGRMTRTWYGLPDGETFAVAGLWRPTAEWGNAYAMVMANAHPLMAEAHDRMPVILQRDHWAQWTHGTPDDAFVLCQPWQGALAVDRSPAPWAVSRVQPNLPLI